LWQNVVFLGQIVVISKCGHFPSTCMKIHSEDEHQSVKITSLLFEDGKYFNKIANKNGWFEPWPLKYFLNKGRHLTMKGVHGAVL